MNILTAPLRMHVPHMTLFLIVGLNPIDHERKNNRGKHGVSSTQQIKGLHKNDRPGGPLRTTKEAVPGASSVVGSEETVRGARVPQTSAPRARWRPTPKADDEKREPVMISGEKGTACVWNVNLHFR